MAHLFLLLISIPAFASTAWFEKVRQLGGEPENSARLLEELKKDGKLVDTINQALKDGIYQAEALEAINRLKLQGCWNSAFAVAKRAPNWMVIQTLQSLHEAEPRKEWLVWSKTQFGPKWNQHSGPLKLSFINVALREKLEIDSSWARRFLKETSPQIRVTGMDLVGRAFAKHANNKVLIQVMKEAMKAEPYQMRLQAFTALNTVPTKTKKLFLVEINACAKKDEFKEVVAQCVQLKNSL